ncbi:class I SAM-dependent methyltransferase [Halarcobacter bivalviorum]|uniref:class I SAM-dependent methyltransferase n=1 Tax=Halarcobacter bivalviorum TaxID=663364 RepID=UPI00100A9B0E|nr:methyltransferase domain-containing protein [Halarcobacter bivalviorum]RXK08186.1 methyltransferase [Halarcobacter bivalviorum]
MKNFFTNQALIEIYTFFNNNKNQKIIKINVINPDLCLNNYAGERIIIDEKEYICRSYKSWNDLAEKFYFRMMTPKIVDELFIELSFIKLEENSFHSIKEVEEKYGVTSEFSRINKNEEPEFFYSYLQALKNTKITKRKRVLNLGVNNAEEFELIKSAFNEEFKNIDFVGVDYCSSAIKSASEKFKEDKNVKFYVHDINYLDELNLGKFDLIISIGTLQSSNLEFNSIFMHIIQNYLEKDGAVILGFPNCRWIGGEVIYGAKAPNYSFCEQSLLYKDAFFCKKYLQQKKFRVTLTGKYYTLLTATSIRTS